MNVSLVMFKSDGSRREFPLKANRLVLGRTNDAGLRIPLSSVSRKHCELAVEGDEIRLRDLGSSNGTFHNGNRVNESTVAAGDQISVGSVVFTVLVDGQPAEIEEVPSVMEQDPVETGAGMPTVDSAPPEPAKPKEIKTPKDEDLPTKVEPELDSPTVDLDDPIAALEALANAQADDDLLSEITSPSKGKKKDKNDNPVDEVAEPEESGSGKPKAD